MATAYRRPRPTNTCCLQLGDGDEERKGDIVCFFSSMSTVTDVRTSCGCIGRNRSRWRRCSQLLARGDQSCVGSDRRSNGITIRWLATPIRGARTEVDADRHPAYQIELLCELLVVSTKPCTAEQGLHVRTRSFANVEGPSLTLDQSMLPGRGWSLLSHPSVLLV